MNNTESKVSFATSISADELTEGDVILYQNNRLLVASEPEYKYQGIKFDALWLDVNTPDNIQELALEPDLLLQLVSHIPASNVSIAA